MSKQRSNDLDGKDESAIPMKKNKSVENDFVTGDKEELDVQSFNDAAVSMKKKKRKEKSLIPSISYDLEELFSLGGKRAQGSHLNFSDIRQLVMLTIHGDQYPVLPAWCHVNAWNKMLKTVIVMAGGISEEDYNENKSCFQFLNTYFADKAIPVQNEGSDPLIKSPLESLLRYRMPKQLKQKKRTERESATIGYNRHHEFILSKHQLQVNEYPKWNFAAEEHGLITTRKGDVLTPAHKDSHLMAMDCEMCNVAGGVRALTRISVVNSKLETVYDKLVKPDVPITDYLTRYSGITAEKLANVSTRLHDVQQDILELISPDTILVGHSLNFDLRALKLHHDNIIDTSVLYTDQRGPRYKSSLRFLVKTHLNRDIQNSEDGHCSIEDAKACMELVQLKIRKGALFASPELETESVFEALTRAGKRGALMDSVTIVRQHCHGNNHSIPCVSDDQVVSNSQRFIKEVDFTFSHIRAYESFLKGLEIAGDYNKKEVLTLVDKYISEILTNVPPLSLIVVSLSSAYVSPDVMAMIRDKEKRKCSDVKDAIRIAKHGLCFVKVTT